MRLRKLTPLLLGLAVLATTATGCVVHGHGHTRAYGSVTYSVDAAPPPARVVYVDPRPGWVWIDGYWYWDGSRWVWIDGFWERERPGYVYVQGSWYTSGGHHHWKPGHWQRAPKGYVWQPSGGGVQVREHAPARVPTSPTHTKTIKVKQTPKGKVKVREHR